MKIRYELTNGNKLLFFLMLVGQLKVWCINRDTSSTHTFILGSQLILLTDFEITKHRAENELECSVRYRKPFPIDSKYTTGKSLQLASSKGFSINGCMQICYED